MIPFVSPLGNRGPCRVGRQGPRMGAFTGTAVTKPQPEPLQMQLPLPPSQCLLTLRGSAINNSGSAEGAGSNQYGKWQNSQQVLED